MSDRSACLISRAALLPPMIEPARTALVIVDIQIDFAAPEGCWAVWASTSRMRLPAIRRVSASSPPRARPVQRSR